MPHLQQQALAQVAGADARRVARLQALDALRDQRAGELEDRAGFINVNLQIAALVEAVY